MRPSASADIKILLSTWANAYSVIQHGGKCDACVGFERIGCFAITINRCAVRGVNGSRNAPKVPCPSSSFAWISNCPAREIPPTFLRHSAAIAASKYALERILNPSDSAAAAGLISARGSLHRGGICVPSRLLALEGADWFDEQTTAAGPMTGPPFTH
jgi:hypothetical protein